MKKKNSTEITEEYVLEYMRKYNEANLKSLKKMFYNYVKNREKINELQKLKEDLIYRLVRKDEYLESLAQKIDVMANEYISYIKSNQQCSTSKLNFLMKKIKEKDEIYKEVQQELIELETMLNNIQQQLDIYENPEENIKVENRDKKLCELLSSMQKSSKSL